MTYRNYLKVSGIIQPWQPEGEYQILFYLEFKLSPSTGSSYFPLCMEGALWRTLCEESLSQYSTLCYWKNVLLFLLSFFLCIFSLFSITLSQNHGINYRKAHAERAPSRSFGPEICGKGSLDGINQPLVQSDFDSATGPPPPPW